ncbi:MAG TPA: VOC family protein [Caulobacteraceae bacterium]|nr:VOC family protein [Caulobacteraceae bacterium]
MRSPDFLTAVGIGVSDLGKSEAFYRDALGMKRTGAFHLDDMDEVMLAHEGRNAVVLMHYTDGSARNYRDNPVKLVFYVTDPKAFATRIKAAGLEVTREPEPIESLGGAEVCLAKDPDGYVIELIKRPASAVDAAERAAMQA